MQRCLYLSLVLSFADYVTNAINELVAYPEVNLPE